MRIIGELQSKEEQVKKTVKTFFEDWMKQRITVEERWGSCEKMQELDTGELPEKFKKMVSSFKFYSQRQR